MKLPKFRPPSCRSFSKSVTLFAGAALALGSASAVYASENCDSPPAHRPTVALALGGGGTRGAAHIGVLRELQKAGIPVDMIAGTSMGAIVGGFYSAGVPIDAIEEKFSKPTLMRNYMTVPISVRAAAIPVFYMPRLVGWKPYDGFYFGNKLRNYLNSCLPPDKQKIEDLKIPFVAVTTNLIDGQIYPIKKGDLARAMQASSAIPVLRRPVPFEDALLVDGGMIANVPVSQARDMGADIVIAVDVDERLTEVPRAHFTRIGSVTHRVEQLFLHHSDAEQLKNADIVIHPHVNGITLLSTRAADAKKAIAAGEAAARAVIPEIKAKLGLPPNSKPVEENVASAVH